jgi:23S rRNA (cytidine1920-2'-O)/16S rRNA (cytidine1409-2'-O)-methyltransferase
MRRRLDIEMVRRGITGSRSEAAVAIHSGAVSVAGRPAVKAGTLVDAKEPIVLARSARRFVSRGGAKLDAALDRFEVAVAGRRALDAGASTGGFTDCLLSRGAAHVVAVDVGYGQLDWRLRQDPRVTVLERTNARQLELHDLPYRPEVVTADLSFISLRLVIPALARCAATEADLLLLVKPQFEVAREAVGPGGVVSDPAEWRGVLIGVVAACAREDVANVGLMASPLRGPAGNVEFLLHGRLGTPAVERVGGERAIEEAVGEALGVQESHG